MRHVLGQKVNLILHESKTTGVKSLSLKLQRAVMLSVAQAPSPSATSVLPQVGERTADMAP